MSDISMLSRLMLADRRTWGDNTVDQVRVLGYHREEDEWLCLAESGEILWVESFLLRIEPVEEKANV